MCLLFPYDMDAPCGALRSLSAATVCTDLCSFFLLSNTEIHFLPNLPGAHTLILIYIHPFQADLQRCEFLGSQSGANGYFSFVGYSTASASMHAPKFQRIFLSSAPLTVQAASASEKLVPVYMYQSTRRYVL